MSKKRCTQSYKIKMVYPSRCSLIKKAGIKIRRKPVKKPKKKGLFGFLRR